MLTTQEAAHYCGMKLSTFRYHVYITKSIAPDNKKAGEWVGTRLQFSTEALDKFKVAPRRGRGKPSKKGI